MANKKGVIVGGGLVGVGLLLFALTKKGEPKPPGEGAATIIIQVYDAQGNLVPGNSPMTVNEGASYTVKSTIKNNSTKGGVPWAASLGIGIYAAEDIYQLIPLRKDIHSFAAGETKSFTYSMNIPLDTGGHTGQIMAWVEDPAGTTIASKTEDLLIGAIAIVYGATIVIS